MEVININHNTIFLSNYKPGKHQNIIIRIGRKLYYMDIEKNATNAHIDLYNYKKNRGKMSKYDAAAELHTITVKSNTYIDRDLLQHIEGIEKAQQVYYKYKNIVDFY